ncbi:MAG: ABC transporter ATP-binding protein/permease [Desulfurococcaceae archaeon]|nr:ABC transporter ATP-binding protein/permease [Desulfurococcaceae archaeon]
MKVSKTGTVAFRELLSLVLTFRLDVAVVSLAIAFNSLATLLSPYVLSLTIDRGIVGADYASLPMYVGLYVLLVLAQWVAQVVRVSRTEVLGQKVLSSLRETMFRRYMSATLDFYQGYQVGDLVSRLVNDTSTVNEALVTGLLNVVGDLVSMLGSLAIMVYLSPQLTLASLVTVPPMVLVARVFGGRLRRAWREVRERVSRLTSIVEESASGIEVVKSFGLEDSVLSRFERTSREVYSQTIRASVLAGLFFPLMGVLSSLAVAVVLIYGGYLYLSGALSIGVLVAFTQYVNRLMGPINDLVFMYDSLQTALAALDRIYEVVKSGQVESDEGIDLVDVRGEVVFDHVWFEYVPGIPVLKDVNITIRPGEVVALVGHTGAGKTTMANLLMKFYEPTRGRILVDGVDIRNVRRSSLRRFISYIPQETFLFPGTVIDNIRVVKPEASDEEVIEVCRRLGIHRFVERLPNGYYTDVGEVGKRLSTGEKQLIAIARALLKDSRIVIVDEALSSVDSETEEMLKKAIRELLRGRTGIVIAHRLTTARDCDRVIVLADGRVVEQGTFSELMAKRGVFYSMYVSQVGGVGEATVAQEAR